MWWLTDSPGAKTYSYMKTMIIGSAVGKPGVNLVRDQVRGEVRDQVRHGAGAEVRDGLRQPVQHRAGGKVRDTLRGQVRDQGRNSHTWHLEQMV